MDELASLAVAAGRGDDRATTALIRATQRDVLRFLGPLTSSRDDVEDLAQETYLRALRGLAGFDGRCSFRTWLLSIARRVAADHVRRAARRPRLTAVGNFEAAVDAVAQTPRFEEQHAITALLGDLITERREAFVATQVLGLSYAEAAEICDCPVGTIRSRVARAREDIITALADRRRVAG